MSEPGRRKEDDENLVAFGWQNGIDQQPSGEVTPVLGATRHPAVMEEPAALHEHGERDLTEQPATGPLMRPGGMPGQGYQAVRLASSVRRLTPVECERLQGFPDGWTCLCQPIEEYAKDPDEAALRCKCPDAPRYKQCGNAVTVTVIYGMARSLPGSRGPGYGDYCRAASRRPY